MKHILVYGDSLSWGIIPGTRQRLAFHKRWPNILEANLNEKGHNYRIIENCLNGRRTVWEDPFKPGRNGLLGLEQQIEIYSPLSLIIIMLGTNDFQSSHNNTAWHATQGVRTLITAIHKAPVEPGMAIPPLLLIAPPEITTPAGDAVEKFAGAEIRCKGLSKHYKVLCDELDCFFFDSGKVIKPSSIDGVHLDQNEHATLGLALTELIKKTLLI